jgi:hypothetical protein
VNVPGGRVADAPRRSRRKAVRNHEEASPFSTILENILGHTPLSLGAALVDYEGETVDYAGYIDPFELKVAAAHLQLLVSEAAAVPLFTPLRELRVRAKKRSLFIRVIDASYSFVMVLHRATAFAVSRRALDETVHLLATEAGLDVIPPCHWFEVDVEAPRVDARGRRPMRVRSLRSRVEERRTDSARFVEGPWSVGVARRDSHWRDAVVIGGLVGLSPRERGFRVSLDSGLELNLVRERNGLWFADERL